MQPDNIQSTEEQRAAFRQAVTEQLTRQTKAIESIRTIMVLFVVLVALGAIFWAAAMIGNGGL